MLSVIWLVTTLAFAQGPSAPVWRSYDLPFHALKMVSSGQELWICGPREQIASSDDGGIHWRTVHEQPDGAVLLNIEFLDAKFGYAGGTSGIVLLTEDGGTSWNARHVNDEAVYQLSFADNQNGIVRTESGIFITADGGTTWKPVSLPQDEDAAKRFRYTFALAALDAKHMAVLLKEGNAQYYGDEFFSTLDGGKTWLQHEFPHSLISSFFRFANSYYAVGHEVIDREHGGGHSVPLAMTSNNGADWARISGLGVCQLHGCTLCNWMGCMDGGGTLVHVSDPVSLSGFAANGQLSSTWAATASKICFLHASSIDCSNLVPLDKPNESEGATPPPALTPPPIGHASSGAGPHCLLCPFDPVFIDPKISGSFKVPMTINIAADGTVESVDVPSVPSPQIGSRLQQTAMSWIFEPTKRDGKLARVKLNTSVQIRVVQPK